MFNVAFIIVMVSLVVQGWTVLPLARRLGLVIPQRIGPVDKVELELPGLGASRTARLPHRRRQPGCADGRIPRWARPSLVIRDGRSMQFQDAGRLRAGDHVYIFVSDRYPRLLDRLFAAAPVSVRMTPISSAPSPLIPARPASELDAAYGVRVERGRSQAHDCASS